MAIFAKIFNRITLPVISATVMGVGAAAIVAMGVSIYSIATEETSIITASYSVDLPQDKEMLKQLEKDLSSGVDLAGDATSLDEIAPAAGAPLHADE